VVINLQTSMQSSRLEQKNQTKNTGKNLCAWLVEFPEQRIPKYRQMTALTSLMPIHKSNLLTLTDFGLRDSYEQEYQQNSKVCQDDTLTAKSYSAVVSLSILVYCKGCFVWGKAHCSIVITNHQPLFHICITSSLESAPFFTQSTSFCSLSS